MNHAQLVKAIDSTNRRLLGRAATAVNQPLAIRNRLVGAYFVESEQRGRGRADYGARLVDRLAADLARRGLKGLGASSLKTCRQFYLAYPPILLDPASRVRPHRRPAQARVLRERVPQRQLVQAPTPTPSRLTALRTHGPLN